MKLTVSLRCYPLAPRPLFQACPWLCGGAFELNQPPPHHSHHWSPDLSLLAQSGWRSGRLHLTPVHSTSSPSGATIPCRTLVMQLFKPRTTRLCFAVGGSDESPGAHLSHLESIVFHTQEVPEECFAARPCSAATPSRACCESQ
jgi:hypothetical protein